MSRGLEVAHIFRTHGPEYRQVHGAQMPLRQLRAMWAVESCRTATWGGHVQACRECGYQEISYNSCRNRHCPKCQTLRKERWLADRQRELLPISYFHLVFTLPPALRPLALRNQGVVYDILFRSAADTLLELGRDAHYLGAELGFIAVLHTWSQTLIDHPHLHCIVTGGGLSLDGQHWIASRQKFLLPVRVLSKVFRGKFLDALRQAYDAQQLQFPGHIQPLQAPKAFSQLLTTLYRQPWVVYCKDAFDNPQHVIDYLGRYTHRVAISNHRIVELENGQVTFTWRDRAHGNTEKRMTLSAQEFIRRFLLHILPEGFVKIRHYGILSNRQRHHQLQQCRELLAAPPGPKTPPLTWQEWLLRLTGIDPTRCPECGQGQLVYLEALAPVLNRGPP